MPVRTSTWRSLGEVLGVGDMVDPPAGTVLGRLIATTGWGTVTTRTTKTRTARQLQPFGRGQLRKALVEHLGSMYPAYQSLGAMMIALDAGKNSICKVAQELVHEGAAEQDRYGRYRLVKR